MSSKNYKYLIKKTLKIKATIYCRQCVYEFLYFIIDNCKPVGCHFLFCIAVIMSWRHTIKIENRDLKWLIDTCNSVQSNLFYWRTNFPVLIDENAQTIPPFYNSNFSNTKAILDIQENMTIRDLRNIIKKIYTIVAWMNISEQYHIEGEAAVVRCEEKWFSNKTYQW